MDKQPNKATDQQNTNAALAALAAAGNSFALGQLWEVNKGFLHRLFWQWYSKNKAIADNAGLTLEDFDQEAFFAVQAAAIAYTPEKGAFTTLLYYYVQSQINKAVCGEHRRNITTKDGRRVAVSANPLNECSSLDVRLDETDEGSSTKGETIEDPAATQAFQTAEDDLYTEELHNALEEALSQLAAKQADVVRRHYFEGKAISEIAREDGTTRNAAQNREQAAFAALRRNPKLQRWRDEIISTRAWSGTGFGAWNHRGSVEERTVEYLEAWEAKSRVWAAERAQLIKEHYADFEASGYFDRNPEQRSTLQTG
ncbi:MULTISPECIES: RNA polymerase sigma factor [Faecalibacterium]|uniref:Sigma-70 family RNA polymerase sigma factor n=1 Tax=Faecalibacterium hominis (ex Afrizal et al. 2022) TaxID=2881265 RepID=A0ABS8FCZ1_9FIRM|nr:sigma-70 family RNA polymerase sigma factor [Faecalibacterium hominis (ex Afrizal et al. 2022)]MCC2212373.1 sigma-70 family RNA polymerase sigma factor [Faecalibacterium hominis (ex Afrizal et al. 2022)]